MYDWTEVKIRRTEGDEWFISIGLWRADGTHRLPRPVRRPWEHTMFLPAPTTQEDVFKAVRGAIEALRDSDGAAGVPKALGAPSQGATGVQ